MSNIKQFWHIGPPNAPYDAPYGNVADYPTGYLLEAKETALPIHLYGVHATDMIWEESISRLENWGEFIWSDDEYPWLTQRGADALLASGLNGFTLTKTVVAGVDSLNFTYPPNTTLPTIHRFEIFHESRGEGQSFDFFIDTRSGRHPSIGLKAYDWLRQAGWQSFWLDAVT